MELISSYLANCNLNGLGSTYLTWPAGKMVKVVSAKKKKNGKVHLGAAAVPRKWFYCDLRVEAGMALGKH